MYLRTNTGWELGIIDMSLLYHTICTLLGIMCPHISNDNSNVTNATQRQSLQGANLLGGDGSLVRGGQTRTYRGECGLGYDE